MKKTMLYRLRMPAVVLPVLFCLATGGGGCTGDGIKRGSPLHVALANATYPSQFVVAGKVTLSGGVFEEEVEPGAASHVQVVLGEETAFGAIGDHLRAAVVVLRTTTGGTGTFVDLAAVPFDGDMPGDAVVAYLGDRVTIKSLKLRDGQIEVDLVTHGPEDPMCCPTVERIEQFAWVGDRLKRLGPAVDSY